MPDAPYRVEKPWGHELIWARTDRYVGKVLHVKAGHVLSCQYHNLKDETMHVLSGELVLRLGRGKGLVERRSWAWAVIALPCHSEDTSHSDASNPGVGTPSGALRPSKRHSPSGSDSVQQTLVREQ